MKNENNPIKMGKRLQQIETMVIKPYTHIWDCCCDHGLLGFNLLSRGVADTIHFIDIVPQLLIQIEKRLATHWPGSKQDWAVHCIDVSELPLKQYSMQGKTDKHLIIIAGVGGELMINLVNQLLCLSKEYQVEFLLCPVHHNYKVREFLIANDVNLIDESLVFENNRGYEILHVTTDAGIALSPVGSVMWDFTNEKHLTHLRKTIAHYQRIAKNPRAKVTDIISQYQALLLT